MDNVGIAELRHRSFDYDVVAEVPGAERMEGDDLDERTQGAAGRLLLVGGVLKDRCGQVLWSASTDS